MTRDVFTGIGGILYLLFYFAFFAAFVCLPIILAYFGLKCFILASSMAIREEANWLHAFLAFTLALFFCFCAYIFAAYLVYPILIGTGMND